jgi:hypothetical protein
MALKLSDAGKSSGVVAPAGNHVARCFSIVDQGTHTETGQFGTKTNRKIRISWELPAGTYIARRQREYSPEAIRNVAD